MGPMAIILGHTTSLRFFEGEPQRGICMTCSSVLAGRKCNHSTAASDSKRAACGRRELAKGHARTWPWVAAGRYGKQFTDIPSKS